MLIFKRVIFALISALTLYIGNVSNLPPKRGGGGGSSDPPTPPLPTPLINSSRCKYLKICGFKLQNRPTLFTAVQCPSLYGLGITGTGTLSTQPHTKNGYHVACF